MGNTVGTISSGIGQIIGKILGHPLEFLSGKSCDSKCGSTWDVMCYIENFCVAHLLKFVMLAALFYFVLLFLYLLFNLGICQCICRTLFRIIRACFSTYFSVLHFCCTSLCHKLGSIKRKRRRRRRRRRGRDIEEFDVLSSSTSENEYELGEISYSKQPMNLEQGTSQVSRRRNYKHEHLRRSLRPNTHRAHVELSRNNSMHHHRKKILKNIADHSSPSHHHLRVARSSKFTRKGSRFRSGIQRRKR